jgi:hypothetical protein
MFDELATAEAILDKTKREKERERERKFDEEVKEV